MCSSGIKDEGVKSKNVVFSSNAHIQLLGNQTAITEKNLHLDQNLPTCQQ
jgi:hypothetical protein